jgi:hypothetical protein
MLITPGQTIFFCGVMTASARPAEAVIILKVEPGGYWPETARLTSGMLGSDISRSNSACRVPVSVNKLLS